MKYIHIIVDTNDTDYNECLTELKQEDEQFIRDLALKIKNFKPYKYKQDSELTGYPFIWTHHHNFPYNCNREDLGEKSIHELYSITEEEEEILLEYLPWGEHGFHTIKNIDILEVISKEELLKNG